MANSKEKYLTILNNQTQNKDVKILKWFLEHIKTENQWVFFTVCKWENNKRIYYPTQELRDLYNSKISKLD